LTPFVLPHCSRHLAPLALVGLLAAPRTASAAIQETQRDSVPGTLVSFEMVKVPGTGLWVGKTEVTWDLYDTFALSRPGSTPGAAGADAVARPTRPYGAPDYGWGHAGYPVISVAYTGALAFCDWLSARTGKRYRLPTEAEWEAVAKLAASDSVERAGLAWHAGNANGTTHPVGTKRPDSLGLHDLLGNAAEWVTPASGRPVLRGGSFRTASSALGLTTRAVQDDTWNERDPQIPQSRWWMSDAPFAGFRIVREGP
jgi:formylglycine-generating enzyme required for sulfatase activity